jgi:hypothetical protein
LLDWGSVRWTQRQPAWGQGNGNFQGLEQPHPQARVVSAITNEFVFTILIKDEQLLIKKHCLFAWKSSMFVKSTTNWQVLIWSANHICSISSKLSKLKPSNDHYKHWTFSVKTLNFVMRIDNVFIWDRSWKIVYTVTRLETRAQIYSIKMEIKTLFAIKTILS